MTTKKLSIIGIAIALSIGITIIIPDAIDDINYNKLKGHLITKYENWVNCEKKGTLKTDKEGVVVGCMLDGKVYEPFTINDWQAISSDVLNIEAEEKKFEKMPITKNSNLFDEMVKKIK